ncbi:MAG TPA: PilZ domain-containing protein [Candidatus Acidoferrum sp.]
MRRSGRIPKEIPIVLIGSDLAGKIFSESTKTVLLSLHGAGLLSRHKLSPEQELVLRWPERNKETEIRIVGQIGEDSGVYTYGVAFSDQVVNFWEMEFPPPSPREQEFGHLTLVCAVCQSLDRIDDTSVEADVCATNEGVLRFCKRCGCSTVWKVGQPGQRPPVQPKDTGPPPLPSPNPIATLPNSAAPQLQPGVPVGSAYSAMPPADLIPGGLPAPAAPHSFSSSFRPTRPAEPAAPSSPSASTSVLTLPTAAEKPAEKLSVPRINRRKYPRIKVNYLALVRHPERGEEFVQCEDVSRGGVRFKSTSRYVEGTLIEIAAPYSSGQLAIFVPGRIVYVQELPEQNLFRYGVQYLNTEKPRGAL